jgi:hypothetical protein
MKLIFDRMHLQELSFVKRMEKETVRQRPGRKEVGWLNEKETPTTMKIQVCPIELDNCYIIKFGIVS